MDVKILVFTSSTTNLICSESDQNMKFSSKCLLQHWYKHIGFSVKPYKLIFLRIRPKKIKSLNIKQKSASSWRNTYCILCYKLNLLRIITKQRFSPNWQLQHITLFSLNTQHQNQTQNQTVTKSFHQIISFNIDVNILFFLCQALYKLNLLRIRTKHDVFTKMYASTWV